MVASKESSVGKESGILSDIQILERLVAKGKDCIFVSPLIDPLEQLGPSSLDLRLGTELVITQNIVSTHMNLCVSKREIEEQKRRYFKNWVIPSDKSFVLHPGEFALAPTLEYIRLPLDIAGRLEGRSSLGRLGLQVHVTAGFVDPGFEGTLTWELVNAGNLPIEVFPGYRIGQICFYRLTEVQVGYMSKKNSKYGGQFGVVLSKPEQDPETGSN